MIMFGSLRKTYVFIRASLIMLREKKVLFIPAVLYNLMAWLVMGFTLCFILYFNLQAAMEKDIFLRIGVLMLPVGILIYGYFFLQGMQVSLVIDHLYGRNVKLSEAWRDTGNNSWALLKLAIVVWLVSLVGALYRWLSPVNKEKTFESNMPGSGFLATILNAAASAVLSIIVPIIVNEHVAPAQALARAWQLHGKANRILDIVVAETGSRIVEGFIWFVLALILWPILVLVYDFAGTGMIVAGILIIIPVVVLFSALRLYINNSLYTCLYLAALEKELETKLVIRQNPISEVLAIG